MVISKLFKSILILVLVLVLILVSNSCVNNNKQSKTRLIAVSCREDYNAKAYYLIKGDTVSSISFHIFKYTDGTYDICISSPDSVYCKQTIKKLKDKTFNCREGHISNELVSELSTFLSLAKDELNFDSLRGFTFWNIDVYPNSG